MIIEYDDDDDDSYDDDDDNSYGIHQFKCLLLPFVSLQLTYHTS